MKNQTIGSNQKKKSTLTKFDLFDIQVVGISYAGVFVVQWCNHDWHALDLFRYNSLEPLVGEPQFYTGF